MPYPTMLGIVTRAVRPTYNGAGGLAIEGLGTVEMEIRTFFSKIYLAGPDLGLRQFLGTAFPITPTGAS